MEILTVPERALDAYGSRGAVLTRAALVDEPSDGFAVDVVRVGPGGELGRHPTRLWQLFLVVDGDGWVAGADGPARPIAAGQAALWAPGEDHASGSATGLLAVVVQCRARPLPAPVPAPG